MKNPCRWGRLRKISNTTGFFSENFDTVSLNKVGPGVLFFRLFGNFEESSIIRKYQGVPIKNLNIVYSTDPASAASPADIDIENRYILEFKKNLTNSLAVRR